MAAILGRAPEQVNGRANNSSATLVEIYRSSQAKGGTLKLLDLSKKFQETLQLTRLLTVFETFNNETQALASFK